MNKTWPCEHIEFKVPRYAGYKIAQSECWVLQSKKEITLCDDVQFCPICGAQRPEPKKKLSEKLKDQYEAKTHRIIDWEEYSKTAIEHIKGIVDEMCQNLDGEPAILGRLKKRLDEEI